MIVAYAKSLNVTVADLLDPAVKELINRASAYVAMTAVDTSEHEGRE